MEKYFDISYIWNSLPAIAAIFKSHFSSCRISDYFWDFSWIYPRYDEAWKE